jgi:hypothetical protein
MYARPSIFQIAMGERFNNLHPKIAERFSVGIGSRIACIATGTMSRIWHRSSAIRPFLHLGARRHILVPERGANVPFTMENWPYLDRSGRETVTFSRTFELPKRRRRFDAQMVYDPGGEEIVDYLGTHQHVVAPLEFRATDAGGLVIRGTELRLAVAGAAVRVPALVTGRAEVHEWFDDRRGVFGINVRVTNPWLGPLFGYEGTFSCSYVDLRRVQTPPCQAACGTRQRWQG